MGGMMGTLPPGMAEMMQPMLENPDFMRMILESNPQMRQMMESNPEIRAALRDPDTLRNLSRAATDPVYQRELVRSQDRAMANIEAMPGGLQALQRAFETIPDAMGSGLLSPSSGTASGGSRSAPGASSEAVPAAGAMPNPWARGGAAAGEFLCSLVACWSAGDCERDRQTEGRKEGG